MLWKWIKKAKDFNSWYSFGSNIVKLIVWIGLFSGLGTFVIGVAGAVLKGVPWPIILMAGVSTLLAVTCLAASPLLIRVALQAMQPVAGPNNALQPIRPHWAAWKDYEKFTVRQAAYLLEDLEPSIHSKDPKVPARMGALCAAIRTGQLDFIRRKEQGNPFTTREYASESTEIPKAALMEFAKRNNIDLKYLGQ
jgi:hypothetical protein